MHGALHKLSEIKLLVSEYVEEECIIVGPKTCAKLQQWFGAASAKELAAQPITSNNTPPSAPPVGEIKRDCLTCGRKRYGTCDPKFCDTGFSGWIPA